MDMCCCRCVCPLLLAPPNCFCLVPRVGRLTDVYVCVPCSVLVFPGSPVDAPPIDGLPVDVPPIDGRSVDVPPIDGPSVDAPPIDGLPVDAPLINGPSVDAPPIDTSLSDAPPTDAPPTDAPPINDPFIDAPPLVDATPTDAPSNPVAVKVWVFLDNNPSAKPTCRKGEVCSSEVIAGSWSTS